MNEFGHLEPSQCIGKMFFLETNNSVDKEPGWVGCGGGRGMEEEKPPLFFLPSFEKQHSLEISMLLRLTKAPAGLLICLLGTQC